MQNLVGFASQAADQNSAPSNAVGVQTDREKPAFHRVNLALSKLADFWSSPTKGALRRPSFFEANRLGVIRLHNFCYRFGNTFSHAKCINKAIFPPEYSLAVNSGPPMRPARRRVWQDRDKKEAQGSAGKCPPPRG